MRNFSLPTCGPEPGDGLVPGAGGARVGHRPMTVERDAAGGGALDLGAVQVVLKTAAPRVNCIEHGPTVAALTWARHAAAHTRVFDEQVAWLATQCSKSAVTELMRIAWRTVGSIVTRVWADVEAKTDRFANLRRIGIDEIRYKKGHKYLVVVVDHDTRRAGVGCPGTYQRHGAGVLRSDR